ncbi:MAG: aspartate ammonia-lyase [Armatimonadota bacterium]
MDAVRIENDGLGEMPVPAEALYGIHTLRAVRNFPLSGQKVHPALVTAYGAVKLACLRTAHAVTPWPTDVFDAMETACQEMRNGLLTQHILVDALQGGAGTSTNMNVNEVLANRALQLLGHPLGSYHVVHPIEDINRYQSTNDTYPTALRVAAIGLIRQLEADVVVLQEAFQAKEHEFADVVKVARTQLQDAVLTTLGREMGCYAEAFARDRWRIYKCEERLRVINLGGTAIGTGIGAPRQYIFQATERLREIASFGLARAENMLEATMNTDLLVEVSGILKALSSNLLKTANDLRLLASGPEAGLAEITLPARQAGSSIMPGKVNPVIPEAAAQAAIMVMGYDQVLTQACSAGNLELNQFMPLIAHCLLNSIELLSNACRIFAENCVIGIQANRERCAATLESSTALVTALAEEIGYERAADIAQQAIQTRRSIREIVTSSGLMNDEQFDQMISPARVTRLGYPHRKREQHE